MNDFNSQENFPFDRLSGLIMDMQPKLLAGVRDSDSLTDSVFLFKEIMLSLGISFCLTEQVPSKLGETIPSLVSGTDEMCIVSKDSFSAFGSEDFVNWLNLRKSDHLILAGWNLPFASILLQLMPLGGDSVVLFCLIALVVGGKVMVWWH